MRASRVADAPWVAVSVTCLVATACYAGAITTNALVAGVLTGVFACAMVVGAQSRKRGVGLALATGLAVAFGWAVVVNMLTGDSNGPAARSTLIAGICTSLAVATARTCRPALFLLPVGGIVFGALALGAGSEVRIVALAVVLAAVGTLAVVEHGQRRWVQGGRRSATVVTVALLVVAAALTGALVQAHRRPGPARTLDPSAVNATIHPAWSDPLPAPAPIHRQDLRSQMKHADAVKTVRHPSSHLLRWLMLIGLALLALLLIAVAILTFRWIIVRRRWWRLKKALRSGSPRQAVAGAWVWARMRLVACRLPLSANAAPELDGAMTALTELPETIATPLRRLSPHVAMCAFSAAPLAEPEDAVRAWRLADEASTAALNALTRTSRWQVAYRPPVETARPGKIEKVGREGFRG